MLRSKPFRRLLAVESLESRRLLTAVTVTNNTDEVNGDVSSIDALIAADGGDGISLREAIEATNATPGADEIGFDFGHDGPETIVLGGTELHIADDLTISGPGADLLAIDGNEENRVFFIDDGTSKVNTVILDGVTIARGALLRRHGGGGILNREDLLLSNSTLRDNSSLGIGGGIYNRQYATLTIVNTTLSGNVASSGGGIHNSSFATLTILDSALQSNSADSQGGGIRNGGMLSLSNSTLVANSAMSGGGIDNCGVLFLMNSTLRLNSAAQGGGIYMSCSYNLTLANSIVADSENSDILFGRLSEGTLITLGVSLISDGSLFSSDSVLSRVDPMLDANGIPLPGSPAIDAGDASLAVDADGNPLVWDQRGEGYRRVLGYGVDIGAFESPGFLPGDSSDDGMVDLVDFNLLKGNFGGAAESYLDGDFSGDGVVDLIDFNILKQNFGARATTTPPSDGDLAAGAAISAVLAEAEED